MQWTSGNRPILLSSLLSNQFSDKETVNGLKKSFSPVHGRWSWKNSESLGTTRFPRIPFRQEFTCHPAIRVDISADLLHGDQDFTTGCLTQGTCFYHHTSLAIMIRTRMEFSNDQLRVSPPNLFKKVWATPRTGHSPNITMVPRRCEECPKQRCHCPSSMPPSCAWDPWLTCARQARDG